MCEIGDGRRAPSDPVGVTRGDVGEVIADATYRYPEYLVGVLIASIRPWLA